MSQCASDAQESKWILDDRFRIGKRLGEGGMGTVYSAEQLGLGRNVAIKILKLDGNSCSQGLERFRREAEILAQLKHRNICLFISFAQTAIASHNMPYIVMELLQGLTLEERLARDGVLPLNQALKITLEVAEALRCAHGNNIIHRDLKPSNIFLVPDGSLNDTVKVTDFGLATFSTVDPERQKLTGPGLIVGTAAYMSPEIVIGGSATARSDVYSLGCVLYECLFGMVPFEGSDTRETMIMQHGARIELPSDVKDLPQNVLVILEQALAKSPEDRFADMDAMCAALRSALVSHRENARRSRSSDSAPNVRKTTRYIASSAGLASKSLLIAGCMLTMILVWLLVSTTRAPLIDVPIIGIIELELNTSVANFCIDSGSYHEAERLLNQSIGVLHHNPEARNQIQVRNSSEHRAVLAMLRLNQAMSKPDEAISLLVHCLAWRPLQPPFETAYIQAAYALEPSTSQATLRALQTEVDRYVRATKGTDVQSVEKVLSQYGKRLQLVESILHYRTGEFKISAQSLFDSQLYGTEPGNRLAEALALQGTKKLSDSILDPKLSALYSRLQHDRSDEAVFQFTEPVMKLCWENGWHTAASMICANALSRVERLPRQEDRDVRLIWLLPTRFFGLEESVNCKLPQVEAALCQLLDVENRVISKGKVTHAQILLSELCLADIYFREGKIEQEHALAAKALAEVEKMPDSVQKKILMLNGLERLSLYYCKTGQPEKALEFAKRQLTLALAVNDHLQIAEAYRQTGIVCQWQKRYEAACDWYTRGIDFCRLHTIATGPLRIAMLASRATCLNSLGRTSEALSHLQEAIDMRASLPAALAFCPSMDELLREQSHIRAGEK